MAGITIASTALAKVAPYTHTHPQTSANHRFSRLAGRRSQNARW